MNVVAPAPAGILDAARQSAETAQFRAQDWFAILRQQGWHTFQSLPLPRRDDEKWRFSDTRSLSLEGYAPAPAPTAPQAADLIARSRLISDAAGLIVHVDGHCVLKPTLAPELIAQGVVFASLEDAIRTHPALLQEHLLKHPILLGGDKFGALHRAWLRAGYVLHVPKGVEVKQPFVAVTWTLTEGVAVFLTP